MFDISFSELMIVAVVALIVIGPERLPKVARTLGHLFGRMQRYVSDVKADISREMELDELRKLQGSMQDAARSIEQSVTREITETQTELNKLADVSTPTAEATASGADEALPATPSEATQPSAAKPQLELGLDSAPQPPTQKQV